jgi:nicotinamide-nucleotide amidase
MIDSDLRARAEAVLDACRERELKVATAESCTGGLISACLTDIAGSSSVFERGFVTYSNEAKEEILGVPAEIILEQGAVSDAVVTAMADGALENSLADISVAVTGIAGPTGGSADKPVGLVYLATARRGGVTRPEHQVFPGGRAEVRRATAAKALELMLARAEED